MSRHDGFEPPITRLELVVPTDVRHRQPVLAVVKHHRDPERFRHETRWLASAGRRVGVRLEVVAPERLEIATRYVAGRTLPDLVTECDLALAAMALLADKVADLAGDGITHGNISPDHVVVARSGAVTLVSPAPNTDAGADRIGLAECLHRLNEMAEAIALEQGTHPWSEHDRRRWDRATALLDDESLGPRRAAVHLGQLAADQGPRRLRLGLGPSPTARKRSVRPRWGSGSDQGRRAGR